MFTRTLSVLIFQVFLFTNYANAINGRGGDLRFGGGLGYTFYLGNQMDYSLTSGFGNFDEYRVGQSVGFYKPINNKWELGGFFRNTSMLTLKSKNTQGLECIFQDLQFSAQRSFNDNIDLSGEKFTINAQFGLGLILFQSRYFTVNPITGNEITNFSTIGLGYQDGFNGTKNMPNKMAGITGCAGINFGFRVSRNINLYLENNLNLTTTNRLSGNLYKRSWIPTDGYWYSGVAVYIRLGRNADACPRFY